MALLGAFLGLIGSISAGFFWYKAKIEKEYASQRDWNHLKNNYAQMVENIQELTEEHDQRFDRLDLTLTEMKAALNLALRINKDE